MRLARCWVRQQVSFPDRQGKPLWGCKKHGGAARRTAPPAELSGPESHCGPNQKSSFSVTAFSFSSAVIPTARTTVWKVSRSQSAETCAAKTPM